MRTAHFCLVAAFALAAQGGLAQPGPVFPATATIERLCSPKGAYGFSFGQAGVPGGDRLTRTISNGFALSPSAAPFDRAKPWSTEWSDRLFAIEYAAPAMSEEAFSALAESIASALRAEGWELQPEDFDPPLYMVTIAGDRTWLRPTEAGGHPTQLVLGLSRSALGVTLGCGRADLMLAHASEVFGNLPPGTPRPKVPEIPVPTPRGETECDRPEVAAEMDRAIASGGLDGFMAALVARTTYRDRLTQWMT